MVQKSILGKTGLKISRLGLGLAEIPRHSKSAKDIYSASIVLNTALDCGINFLDTAACYGNTEEMIGNTVAHRRDEYILATKCGHVVGGFDGFDWSGETIVYSIERSLKRLKTDYLDLIQLHSCSINILEQGDVIEQLVSARDSGKTRFIGYSGDNDAANWAVNSGIFDTLQTSFNIVDQNARNGLLSSAKNKAMGTIIKRPLANGVWGKDESPNSYANEYMRRANIINKMGKLPYEYRNPTELALSFVLAESEVDTAIVGTHNPSHIISNVAMLDRGLQVSIDNNEELHRRFNGIGPSWPQLT